MRKLTEEWETEWLELIVKSDHIRICIGDRCPEHVGNLFSQHPVLILGNEQMLQIFQAWHLQMFPGDYDVLLQLPDLWERHGCFKLLDLRIGTFYVSVKLLYELLTQSQNALLVLFELVQISREFH